MSRTSSLRPTISSGFDRPVRSGTGPLQRYHASRSARESWYPRERSVEAHLSPGNRAMSPQEARTIAQPGERCARADASRSIDTTSTPASTCSTPRRRARHTTGSAPRLHHRRRRRDQPFRLLEHTSNVPVLEGFGFRFDCECHAGGSDRDRVDVPTSAPRQRVAQPPALRLELRERSLHLVLRAGADPAAAGEHEPVPRMEAETDREQQQKTGDRRRPHAREPEAEHRDRSGAGCGRPSPRQPSVLLAACVVHATISRHENRSMRRSWHRSRTPRIRSVQRRAWGSPSRPRWNTHGSPDVAVRAPPAARRGISYSSLGGPRKTRNLRT